MVLLTVFFVHVCMCLCACLHVPVCIPNGGMYIDTHTYQPHQPSSPFQHTHTLFAHTPSLHTHPCTTPTPQNHTQLGSVLIKLLVDTARIQIPSTHNPRELMTVNAFSHGIAWHNPNKHRGGSAKPVGVFRAHDAVIDILTKGNTTQMLQLDNHLPMVIRPFPWTSVRIGGYFTNDAPIMRTRGDSLQLRRLLDADRRTKV